MARFIFLILSSGILLPGCGGKSGGGGGGGTQPDTFDVVELSSPGQISVNGVDQVGFNAATSTVSFVVAGETFDIAPETVLMLLNDLKVPNTSIQITDLEITLLSGLVQGLNRIILIARDSQGLSLTAEVSFWVGADSQTVQVLDETGQPVTGAEVVIRLSDDLNVFSQAVSTAGQATFTNLPNRTFIIQATTSDNGFASVAAIIGDSPVLVLKGFDAPSAIDNNDFSLDSSGWELDADGDGIIPIEIVTHDEGSAAFPAPGEDMDLVLNTSGEGPQSISRTFTIKPGTKNVKVRYRFVTSEVPGGYFGSQYNDCFSVSIRSLNGGGSVSEQSSMNALGLGAFDAEGATAWRERNLVVNEAGDTVQVDVMVANVADGLLDSYVVVDILKEQTLRITALQLRDIDNSALQYLSVSEHAYFGGNTRIHGTVTIEGPADDSLTSLELELLEAGGMSAKATLTAGVQGSLLTSFGADEKVEITTAQLLFELSSSEAAKIDQLTNGTITLRARAQSQAGEVATKEFGAVGKLVRFTGDNRYGGRDAAMGGDDWVKPSVKTVAEHFNGILWGDFSNMNGGAFAPHATHRSGHDIDGWFNGYNAINAVTAQTIIDQLNDPVYGSRILVVYVTFSQVSGNPFWDAIKTVTLNDGRQASDVIQRRESHNTHFHWIVSE